MIRVPRSAYLCWYEGDAYFKLKAGNCLGNCTVHTKPSNCLGNCTVHTKLRHRQHPDSSPAARTRHRHDSAAATMLPVPVARPEKPAMGHAHTSLMYIAVEPRRQCTKRRAQMAEYQPQNHGWGSICTSAAWSMRRMRHGRPAPLPRFDRQRSRQLHIHMTLCAAPYTLRSHMHSPELRRRTMLRRHDVALVVALAMSRSTWRIADAAASLMSGDLPEGCASTWMRESKYTATLPHVSCCA